MMSRIAMASAVLVLAGCFSGEPARYDLSGTVTYKNKPVPAGQIIFTPSGDKGNPGPGTSAEIKDGQYHTPKGKGTIGGPHVVLVSGFDGKAVPIPGDPNKNVIAGGQPIFPPTRIEIDLPKEPTTRAIDVPAK